MIGYRRGHQVSTKKTRTLFSKNIKHSFTTSTKNKIKGESKTKFHFFFFYFYFKLRDGFSLFRFLKNFRS